MAVGTGNITLNDVITEIQTKAPSIEFPTTITLESAFKNSVPSGFDSTWRVNDGKQSLKDFRGYIHPPEALQLGIYRGNGVYKTGDSRILHDYWIEIVGDSNPADRDVTYIIKVTGSTPDFKYEVDGKTLYGKGLTDIQYWYFTIPEGSMKSNTLPKYTLTAYKFKTNLGTVNYTTTPTKYINYNPTYYDNHGGQKKVELINSTTWSYGAISQNIYLQLSFKASYTANNPFRGSVTPTGYSEVTVPTAANNWDWIGLQLTYRLVGSSGITDEYARPGTKVSVIRKITAEISNSPFKYTQKFEFNMSRGVTSYTSGGDSNSLSYIQLPKIDYIIYNVETTLAMKDSFTDFLPLSSSNSATIAVRNSTIIDKYTFNNRVKIVGSYVEYM